MSQGFLLHICHSGTCLPALDLYSSRGFGTAKQTPQPTNRCVTTSLEVRDTTAVSFCFALKQNDTRARDFVLLIAGYAIPDVIGFHDLQ